MSDNDMLRDVFFIIFVTRWSWTGEDDLRKKSSAFKQVYDKQCVNRILPLLW